MFPFFFIFLPKTPALRSLSNFMVGKAYLIVKFGVLPYHTKVNYNYYSATFFNFYIFCLLFFIEIEQTHTFPTFENEILSCASC